MSVAMSILLYAGFSSADASNFSGQNAIFLAADSQATLTGVTLDSDADGANAVFATGQQAKITASHLKIHTKNNSSRGLDATYGGTITANDVDITTEGQHCAALATDRGEGNISVSDATLKTSGDGSPCVYSTGNIQLSKAIGEATGSEIAVVEGKNGGNFTLNTTEQTLTGDILANNISELHINLGDKTTWTGTINSDNQAKTANLTLAATATWTLTADAYVTTFSDAQAHYRNIQSQGHNIYYSKASNPKLNGKTIPLPGGGQLMAK